MFTALTMHVFHVEKFLVAFLRVLQRAFVAQAFFMLISFIFSYSEDFFVVVYLSSYFVLGHDPSARDLICLLSHSMNRFGVSWTRAAIRVALIVIV